MNGIPRELDWVKERAACSLAKVFSDIHRGVEEDVKSANSIFPHGNPLEVIVADKNAFTVKRGASITPVVMFILESGCIVVSATLSNEEWRFTVGLNNEGRCQLRWESQEFEQWQVRKMALEGLFFNS